MRSVSLLYDVGVSPEQAFRWHVEWGKRFPDVPRPVLRPGPKIRVGYVSSDFRMHATAYFLLPILETHDRQTFEIFLYSKNTKPDQVTAWFKKLGAWREIGDDGSAFDLIRADNIDILVDLNGHTTGKSLSLFARRPAPIAATYLGYPDTTGLRQIDYRLTDEIADPEGSLAVESLVRLPHGSHTYRCLVAAPAPVVREGPVVFGYLGRTRKVNPVVAETWQKILDAVPGSRLLLNQENNLTAEGYYAAYNTIDIALDPFPYNGTTTICDGLWMGVPAIALYGDRSESRIGASLLARVGLQDLVASNLADYVAAAVRLAADRPRLSALRQTLRQRFLESPLGNPAPVTRDMEAFYAEAVAKELRRSQYERQRP
jgi:predicted O-linked N-acetylglucosamine transferase (SPINDLY family)